MRITLRKASSAPFPYGWPGHVAYGFLTPDGALEQAPRTRDEFRTLVRQALAGQVRLIAAWPGEFRTDLFEIDDPTALASAIGLAAEVRP